MNRGRLVTKNTEAPNTEDFHTRALLAEQNGDWEQAARYYSRSFEQHHAEINLLNSVQEGLSSRMEMPDIYNLVGDKLRDTFNAQIVMISQYDPLTRRIFHHYAVEKGVHLHLTEWSPVDTSRARIVRTGKPFMINYAEILELITTEKMHVVPGTQMPMTWLGVPMLVGDEVKGIVSLQNLDHEHAFTQSDINLLATLTSSMSLSLENARLMKESQRLLKLLEGEMEIARQTQQSILPDELPSRKGYDFGSLIVPARTVSGDFYDFIPIGRDSLCIVIGDVTDKGLPAALFMALTFSLIRSETRREENPEQVLQNVNRALLTMNASGMFVTLIYCVLNFRTGHMRYARAGHPLPVLMDASGKCLDIPMKEGQPLGIFPDVKIDQQEILLPHGGLALLYSDGLAEAMDSKGQEFGLERVRAEFARFRKGSALEICNKLWEAVKSHSDEHLHQDDFTAVVIKRE